MKKLIGFLLVAAPAGCARHASNPPTALMAAAGRGDLAQARALLDAGAHIDVKDSWRSSAWHYLQFAITRDRGAEMTRLILSLRNAPVVDQHFLYARETAKQAGNDEVVRLLTQYLAAHQPGPCPGPTEPQVLCGRQI